MCENKGSKSVPGFWLPLLVSWFLLLFLGCGEGPGGRDDILGYNQEEVQLSCKATSLLVKNGQICKMHLDYKDYINLKCQLDLIFHKGHVTLKTNCVSFRPLEVGLMDFHKVISLPYELT